MINSRQREPSIKTHRDKLGILINEYCISSKYLHENIRFKLSTYIIKVCIK